jgi:histo-blood group ABO system transferase
MKKKIILHIIATGKYYIYIDGIIRSASKYFLKDTDLTFIIYTDWHGAKDLKGESIVVREIKHEPWPSPTLKRFHYFLLSEDLMLGSDYSFYIDVDSEFLRDISLNTLGLSDKTGMSGTLHPGFINKKGTPEYRKNSTSYIEPGKNTHYFCGGFFGGSSLEFIQMSKTIKNNIEEDLKNGIIAIWHDESHLNRFFLDNPPISILGAGFSSPEEQIGEDPMFFDPYISFLNKNEELKKEKKRI